MAATPTSSQTILGGCQGSHRNRRHNTQSRSTVDSYAEIQPRKYSQGAVPAEDNSQTAVSGHVAILKRSLPCMVRLERLLKTKESHGSFMQTKDSCAQCRLQFSSFYLNEDMSQQFPLTATVTEWRRQKGVSGDHPAQPAAVQSRVSWNWLPRTASRQVLNISKAGDSTTSSGSLCRCSTTRSKNIFPFIPFTTLQFVPTASCPVAGYSLKRARLHLLYSPTRDLYTLMRSPQATLSPGRTAPALPTQQVLQLLNQLWGSLPDSLHYAHASLVRWSPALG